MLADLCSRPRLSSLLFFLIIFLIPTQLGLHFWPDSSLVYGIRLDYLSPTIYFLDVLIILYLFVSGHLKNCLKFGDWNLIIIVPILLTNLLYSNNSPATLSWSLHLVLYLLFLSTITRPSSLVYPLTLALFFQSALALTQFYLGHSVNGLLYYLGERSVSVGQPGVALGTFMGNVVLRSYATFSHPNILAGWLLLSFLIIYKLSPNPKLKTLVFSFTTLGVLLTQSRSALLTLFGIIVPFLLIKKLKFKILYFVILFSTISWIPSTIHPPRSELSFTERLNLQTNSIAVIKNFPIFGSGAQASISTYPQANPNARLLQPDHNSFSLFLSWFGIFGVLAILQIIPCTSSAQAREKCLQTLCSLGGLLFLDHYFLTSPQGLFIFLLYLK